MNKIEENKLRLILGGGGNKQNNSSNIYVKFYFKVHDSQLGIISDTVLF